LEYTEWYQALEKVFSLVGSHVSVDRIYYFEIHTNPSTGQEITSQRFEWVNNGIEPMIDNPDLQNIPIEFAEDFMKPLHQNMPFESIVRELPDGNTKDILSSQSILSILVLPINIQDRIYGFIGFDDCTSERKWREEEMHFLKSITSNLSSAIFSRNALLEVKNKALELEKINQELEQFAYVASHDLQEPLRMVTGFLKLFEKKYIPIIDEKGKTYIHYAVDGATRMKRIINDLLEYARIGKSENILEDVAFEELCNELQYLFKNKAIGIFGCSWSIFNGIYRGLPLHG
jgi:signal transduction histidine kinase